MFLLTSPEKPTRGRSQAGSPDFRASLGDPEEHVSAALWWREQSRAAGMPAGHVPFERYSMTLIAGAGEGLAGHDGSAYPHSPRV